MINAREFVDQIADQLRAKGRQVEITETEEAFGTFVWMSAIAPKWYDYTISLSAAKGRAPGSRWKLGRLTVRGAGKERYTQERSRIRSAIDIYA